MTNNEKIKYTIVLDAEDKTSIIKALIEVHHVLTDIKIGQLYNNRILEKAMGKMLAIIEKLLQKEFDGKLWN